MISIKGLDKAAVFAALYNNARPQGLGYLQYTPENLSIEEARQLMGLNSVGAENAFLTNAGQLRLYFDYVRGRVMKVDLSGDELQERLYDRDNGPGAAARAIASIPLTTHGTEVQP